MQPGVSPGAPSSTTPTVAMIRYTADGTLHSIMAHFAKLGIGNIVERVNVVSNDVATTEQAGIDFLKNLHGQDTNWKQTSYNTYEGVHSLGGTPLRKNFAGIGYTYDETKRCFHSP
jgi:hypothetical protein